MNKFKVPIKNIIYIYSYVWDKVRIQKLIKLDCLDDYLSPNVYAELFLINIEPILKKGLYRMYIEINEEIRGIKGKIDFETSLNKMSLQNAKAYCTYDQLEVNNIFNQILKSTAIKLLSLDELIPILKKRLKNIILHFNQINTINISKKTFNNLKFDKNNNYYYLIIKICELINEQLILDNNSGIYKFIDLFDDESNFDKIFEKFIYKFYKKNLSNQYAVYYQKQIHWNFFEGNLKLLPIMQLDITLISNDETIIIDTKYYKKFYNTKRYDQEKFINEHLFQMSSYLTNYNCTNSLKGIILYPKPQTGETINETYKFNKPTNNGITTTCSIKIATIDLSQDWRQIESNLKKLIHEK